MEGKLIKLGENDYILHVNNKPFAYKKLSLKNCQAIENGYDLDELVNMETEKYGTLTPKSFRRGFLYGFQKALELIGDKKFSEEDVLDAWEDGTTNNHPLTKSKKENLLKSLQQTEWDVEIVYDRDCYSSGGRCDKSTMANCTICTPVTYLKDADGCLILRRI